MPKSDSELVRAAQKGNKKAFEELVERYHRPLFGYIYLRTQNYYSSEDVTQESFLRAFRSLRKCSEPAGFADWLFTIAQNCCLEWVREKQKHAHYTFTGQTYPVPPWREKAKVDREMQQNSSESEFDSDQKELIKSLPRRLKELPRPYYLVLSMKYQKRMTCAEIARVLGQPLGTVTSTLARAYKLLRKEIKKDEPG